MSPKSSNMAEQRNIVVVGGGPGGVLITHYIMKHILPKLKAKHRNAKYHVYNINPSAEFYFRVASPRAGTSAEMMPFEKIIVSLNKGYKAYSPDDFTFIQAFATGLDTKARKVSYKRENQAEEYLPYHALVAATGSKTHHPAFSMPALSADTRAAVKAMNTQVAAAKDVVIVGGGPTGVEVAGEIAEFRNGKPGWFSSASRNVNITLLTNIEQLLPTVPTPIAKNAEKKLKALNVDVQYNTRVDNISELQDGRKKIQLANGKELVADLYIPAYGVLPNSSWLPTDLLDEKKYLITNPQTLRVDEAGPRVYAFGDISSASRNTVVDILGMLPVTLVNITRDLVSYNPDSPSAPAPGKDRIFTPAEKTSIVVPIGTGGGVGCINGWSMPSFFVWLIKGRDYMVGMSRDQTVFGTTVKKEYKMTKEEAVI